MIASLSLLVYEAASQEQTTTLPTATALESQAIDQRLAIRSGMFSITVDGEYAISLDDTAPKQRHFNVMFNRDAIRVDSLKAPNDGSQATGTRECRSTIAGTYYFYTDRLSKNGRTIAARVSDVTNDGCEHPKLMNPRFIGYCLGTIDRLREYSPVKARHQSLAKEQRVTEELLGDIPTLRADAFYDLKVTKVFSGIWYAPNFDGSVVKCKTEFTRSEGVFQDEMECSEFRKDIGDVWFPHTILYTQRLNNKLLVSERISVEAAKFNVELKEEEFTLAGFNVPVGTTVLECPSVTQLTRTWNGKELFSSSSDKIQTARSGSVFRVPLLAINLIAIAAILMVMYLRKRGSVL